MGASEREPVRMGTDEQVWTTEIQPLLSVVRRQDTRRMGAEPQVFLKSATEPDADP